MDPNKKCLRPIGINEIVNLNINIAIKDNQDRQDRKVRDERQDRQI